MYFEVLRLRHDGVFWSLQFDCVKVHDSDTRCLKASLFPWSSPPAAVVLTKASFFTSECEFLVLTVPRNRDAFGVA